MYNHLDALEEFKIFVDELQSKLECDDKELSPFTWSDYLAYSAAKHLDTFDTLTVHPGQIVDDGNEHEFLREVATFRNHD